MARSPHAIHDLHEGIYPLADAASGLRGVIAIHSTALGPAAGGCRLWAYPNQQDLMGNALRLAQGMSFKNALAGLPLGGGQAVLQVPCGQFDRRRLFDAFGGVVRRLRGQYVTAEDFGTSVADMEAVRSQTRFVAGLPVRAGHPGGDPSPWTALGVFLAIKAVVEQRLERPLEEASVAVQGLGAVGRALCRLLHEAGAALIVADLDRELTAHVAHLYGAAAVAPDELHRVRADVFAPCALGAALSEATIGSLGAPIVCGAADNQLASAADGERLRDRGVLYCPDYIVNAGGITNVAAEYLGESLADVETRVRAIPTRLLDLLRDAEAAGIAPAAAADDAARRVIAASMRRAAA